LLRPQIELEIEPVGARELIARKDDRAYAIIGVARKQPFLQAREDLQLGLHRHFADNLLVEIDEDAGIAGVDPGVIGTMETKIQSAAGKSAEEQVGRGPKEDLWRMGNPAAIKGRRTHDVAKLYGVVGRNPVRRIVWLAQGRRGLARHRPRARQARWLQGQCCGCRL
jgi:hypothetical protein